ncbi:hypothetical protein BLA29_013535 [Euroglyphus maynei]|uniref:F5/8 type C domain-containing protein n=1 Tax=Euroglyphus maynei TaxID=6958 RepID=A0A1Y3AU64_EURMA|nr:hypothetical protein BLA29_013535 [Euroglyphus maynei]
MTLDVCLLHPSIQMIIRELQMNEHEDSSRIRIPSSLCNGQSHSLGMESGEIRDHQITSSSSYNLQSVGPQNAR